MLLKQGVISTRIDKIWTFIEPLQTIIDFAVKLKLSPTKEDARAKEVQMRIAKPPIIVYV